MLVYRSRARGSRKQGKAYSMLSFNAYFRGLLVCVKQVIRRRKHSSPVWAGQGIGGTRWRGEQGNAAAGLMDGQIGADWGWQ